MMVLLVTDGLHSVFKLDGSLSKSYWCEIGIAALDLLRFIRCCDDQMSSDDGSEPILDYFAHEYFAFSWTAVLTSLF